ncbi:putative hydrolase YugF [Bienertia sinuspersici]
MVMCTENRVERKQLIEALHKDRKLANLPKINQNTLIIWGEHDQIFPIELGHRLKSMCRYIGESAELVTIKKAGHAVNLEKPKVIYKNMKSFLLNSPTINASNGNGK